LYVIYEGKRIGGGEINLCVGNRDNPACRLVEASIAPVEGMAREILKGIRINERQCFPGE
jgi:hypothetical protein